MTKQVNSSGKNINEMKFSRNDLRVLAAIRDCGFIRTKQLNELLPFRAFKRMSLKQTYGFTNRLSHMGLVDLNQRALPGNAGVFTTTPDGHSMLRECNCGVRVNADPLNGGEASVEHFVKLNDIMVKFHKEFSMSYWLTDFLVRSENELRQEEGFAKDYDSVCELEVNGKPLTLAVEYEHTLKNRTKYHDAFKSYMADPYVQLVLLVVDSPDWIAPYSESIKVPGRRLCFVTSEHFLTQPFNSMRVVRWNGPALEAVPILQAMQQASENKYTKYLPSHTPPK